MKKLILSELLLLFLATTFISDNQPGWFQQTLPINDFINDIFFLDSLNGWVVTQGNYSANDTSYIMRTTNGGTSWTVQKSGRENLNAVQFLDINTGYAGGGTNGTIYESFYKTINGGGNWIQMNVLAGVQIKDIFFINKDTGWVCDDNSINGSLNKTTNGGLNWVQQLNNTYRPLKLFFINKDTGWTGTNEVNGRLFRTTNGGTIWDLQYTSNFPVEGLFFLDNLKGWLRGGTGNGVMYTIDGGFTWLNAQGNTAAGFDLRFINDSIGYSGMQSYRIPKSTDGGKSWGYQNSPIQNNMSVYMFRNDTLKGWAGGTGIVKTDDGGGTIISSVHSIGNEIPSDYKLYQNYPNPFNPSTIIRFQITSNVKSEKSNVKMVIYNIQGKEITVLIDGEYKTGTYEVDFSGQGLSSGIYFYSLIVDGNIIDTKKMVIVK